MPGALVALGIQGAVSGHLTLNSAGDRSGLNEVLMGGIISAVCLVTGRTYDINAVLNTLPAPTQGSKRIVHIDAAYVKQLHVLLPFNLSFTIRIRVRLIDINEDSPAGLPSYEQAPGGYYLVEVAHREQNTIDPRGPLNWTVRPLIDNTTHVEILTRFCFVPAPSGIDLPYTSPHALTQAELYQPYTDDNPATTAQKSRAARFITQEPTSGLPANTRHIAFTTRNAKFIYSLIATQAPVAASCVTLCGLVAPQISGPSNICAGGATYSVLSIPDARYDWAVTNGLEIVQNPPYSNTIIVRRLNGVPRPVHPAGAARAAPGDQADSGRSLAYTGVSVPSTG